MHGELPTPASALNDRAQDLLPRSDRPRLLRAPAHRIASASRLEDNWAITPASLAERACQFPPLGLSQGTTDEKQGGRGYVSDALCEDVGHQIGCGPFSQGVRSAPVASFCLERGSTGAMRRVFARAGAAPARGRRLVGTTGM